MVREESGGAPRLGHLSLQNLARHCNGELLSSQLSRLSSLTPSFIQRGLLLLPLASDIHAAASASKSKTTAVVA